jgi:hypothetical protein
VPAAAPPPGPSPALKELERKIQPPPAVPAPPAEEGLRLAQVEASVRSWIQEIDQEHGAEAGGALINEAEIRQVAAEGLQTILVSNLLPENLRSLQSLLRSAQGKDVRVTSWKAGKLYETSTVSHYREKLPMMHDGRLELSIDQKPAEVTLDLMALNGRWKIFKLEVKS